MTEEKCRCGAKCFRCYGVLLDLDETEAARTVTSETMRGGWRRSPIAGPWTVKATFVEHLCPDPVPGPTRLAERRRARARAVQGDAS